MENKKEYLNEEWYQKAKKKVTRISLIILIASILLGGGLIVTGIIKTNTSKKEAARINEERYNAAYKESEEKAAKTKARLEEIATEKESLNNQYNAKNNECNSLNMSDSNWFAKKSSCQNEIIEIQKKITNLETEEFNLNNEDNTVYYSKVYPKNYIFLIIIGIFILFSGCSIALIIYLVAKKREIAVFTIQQSMPVAQEAIDKMAPTVGNAAGTIADSVAKGITEGIKNGSNNEEK